MGGRADTTKGAISSEDISTIGFLIADKETGPFDLHIHSIKPYWLHDNQVQVPVDSDSEAVNLANWYQNNWYSRNDDVMGGISHGNKVTGNLKFWGSLSMENNG